MKVLDLFSGIGGFSLAADWMGWETVAFCEREPFPRKVLTKHWPGVPIHDDVRKIEEFEQYAGTVELICGGYPCQPFSVAGKQKGQKDDRHLWPAMFEIIKSIRPRWVVAENVAGHVRMGLDDVLSELESENYTAQTFIIPACAVNAQHRRDRVWIVAHSSSAGTRVEKYNPSGQEREASDLTQSEMVLQGNGETITKGALSCGDYAANSESVRCRSRGLSIGEAPANPEARELYKNESLAHSNSERESQPEGFNGKEWRRVIYGGQKTMANPPGARWRTEHVSTLEKKQLSQISSKNHNEQSGHGKHAVEPGICRSIDGISPVVDRSIKIPNRNARIKALGNAIVPQVAYQIFRAIEAADEQY